MHCCLGNWFKKKLAQSFNTCSYQHWQRLPSEPRLPISALVCLAHCGARWKLLANPHRGSACFPEEADFPLGCAVSCAHPQAAGQDCSGISCICSNLSNLEQQKFILSRFWMAGVWNCRVCGSMLSLDTRRKIRFLSLSAYGGSGNNFILTLVNSTILSVLPPWWTPGYWGEAADCGIQIPAACHCTVIPPVEPIEFQVVIKCSKMIRKEDGVRIAPFKTFKFI